MDAAGRLIGINQSILSRTSGNQGVGFSVPINLARYVMERIVACGKVTRGYMGVVIQPVTTELAKEFKLPGTCGALVSDVSRKSPAAEAGIKSGDVIVEYNGKKVTDNRQLRLMVAQTVPPGTQVNLKLVREGRAEALTLKLEEQPRDDSLVRADTSRDGNSQDLLDRIAINDLTPALRRQFRIPNCVEGIVIAEVELRSTAALAGLSRDDVILEINHRPVADIRQALELSRNLNQGDRMLASTSCPQWSCRSLGDRRGFGAPALSPSGGQHRAYAGL
ncbi:MAG TPA: PDZ domain-containing protein [Roseimicrobium sp.]|nr:PDZ domain-containing protein [Roseimicrobium sp.]